MTEYYIKFFSTKGQPECSGEKSTKADFQTSLHYARNDDFKVFHHPF